MKIIEAENLIYKYPSAETPALKGVSLSVEQGEFLSVIGHNGSGKSTMAKLINGLLMPSSGAVKVKGLTTAEKKNLFEIRKTVGVVFQNPDNQLVASIVEDDVAFGPENIGLPREEIGKRIEYALSVTGLTEFKKSSPERLSGGQKQRVAVAGVLAIKPEVLILDESTSMLDPKGRKEVIDVVKKLNKEEGITVINITHYMDEVCSSDRVIVMNNGSIVMQGTPKEIFSKKQELKKYELDIPVPMQIADRLNAEGFTLPENVYTREDLGRALCESLQKI